MRTNRAIQRSGICIVFSLIFLPTCFFSAEPVAADEATVLPRLPEATSLLEAGQIGWFADPTADPAAIDELEEQVNVLGGLLPYDLYLVHVPASTGWTRLQLEARLECWQVEEVEIHPDLVDDDPSDLGFDLRSARGCVTGDEPRWLARVRVVWNDVSELTCGPTMSAKGSIEILDSRTTRPRITTCDERGPYPMRLSPSRSYSGDPPGSLGLYTCCLLIPATPLELVHFPALDPVAVAPATRFAMSSRLDSAWDSLPFYELDRRSSSCSPWSAKVTGLRFSVKWDATVLDFVETFWPIEGWTIETLEVTDGRARFEVVSDGPDVVIENGDPFVDLLFRAGDDPALTSVVIDDLQARWTCVDVSDQTTATEWNHPLGNLPRSTTVAISHRPDRSVRRGDRSRSITLDDVRRVEDAVAGSAPTAFDDLLVADVNGDFTLDRRDVLEAMRMTLEASDATPGWEADGPAWTRTLTIADARVAEIRLRLPHGTGDFVGLTSDAGEVTAVRRADRLVLVSTERGSAPRTIVVGFDGPEPADAVVLTGARGIDDAGRDVTVTVDHDARIATDAPAATRVDLDLRVAPNPFNPVTTIGFRLERSSVAAVRVFDARGRRVRTLLEGETLAAGPHEVNWDGRTENGRTAASGVYFVEVTTPVERARRPITLLQ